MKLEAKHKRIIRTLVLALVIVVLLGCLGLHIEFYAIDGPTFEQGQERASNLLIALEEYTQIEGRYPADLERLIPDHLSTIPRPAWRYGYYYEPCSKGTSYILYFRLVGSADDWCGYSSKAREWACADSLPPYYYAQDSPCYSE